MAYMIYPIVFDGVCRTIRLRQTWVIFGAGFPTQSLDFQPSRLPLIKMWFTSQAVPAARRFSESLPQMRRRVFIPRSVCQRLFPT
jgi:hypothetical protein